MQVDIDIDDSEIRRKLALMASFISNMVPVYNDIGLLLKRTTDESFINEVSPWGEKWLPWKTVPKVAKGKKQRTTRSLLHNTGALSGRFSYLANNSGVIFGTNVKSEKGYPYPIVHQFGRLDGTMKARSFMPITKNRDISPETKEKILEILHDKLLEILNK